MQSLLHGAFALTIGVTVSIVIFRRTFLKCPDGVILERGLIRTNLVRYLSGCFAVFFGVGLTYHAVQTIAIIITFGLIQK